MLKKPKIKEFENIDILQMAQIIYSDGKKDFFEAIQILENGVFTGRIKNQNEFINGGFIPKQSIRKIMGGTKRKLFKMKSKKF